MKLCVRKIYCNICKKLVICNEKQAGSEARISCPSCKTSLWTWNGVGWRYTGADSARKSPSSSKSK